MESGVANTDIPLSTLSEKEGCVAELLSAPFRPPTFGTSVYDIDLLHGAAICSSFDEIMECPLASHTKSQYQTWLQFFKEFGRSGKVWVTSHLAAQIICKVLDEASDPQDNQMIFAFHYYPFVNLDARIVFLSWKEDVIRKFVPMAPNCRSLGLWLVRCGKDRYLGLCDKGIEVGDRAFWERYFEMCVKEEADMSEMTDIFEEKRAAYSNLIRCLYASDEPFRAYMYSIYELLEWQSEDDQTVIGVLRRKRDVN